MNKVYEYVTKQEKLAEDMEKATGLQMFNNQATAYWAVRQFMEVNELTQRLYTASELVEACRRGEDGLAEYMNELNK